MTAELLGQKLETLNAIFRAFERGDAIVPISTELGLTKTRNAPCEAMLFHDRHLEAESFQMLNERLSMNDVLSRYEQLAPRDRQLHQPNHFAAKVLSGRGAISSGENIFLFFPECLGLSGHEAGFTFGVELIDVWANIFHKVVFPCVRRVFDLNTQVSTMTKLSPMLEKTIYLASVFHEIGHQVGCWRVSPVAHISNRVSAFHLDIMGELQTDSLLVQNLREFDQIFYFVLLQRLFWFGRRGFASNPLSARLNSDNDSLISALLWNELVKHGAIIPSGHRFELRADAAKTVFSQLAKESENVGTQAFRHSAPEDQNAIVERWLREKIDWNATDGYTFSQSQQNAFSLCLEVEEIPLFSPMMAFQTLGELRETAKARCN